MRGGPVYIVKPKYIFKHPFNRFDLTNHSSCESQNEQLTDFFNYGFNDDTMNIYGKLVKRFIEVLDHHKNLEYFNEPSELMRLNDEIPMDFGGFGKFHDPWIVDNETPKNFHDGEKLMQYFIMMIIASAGRKVEYPLIEFVKHMYKKEGEEETDTDLYDIIEQIGRNLEQKYEETMKRLVEKQNQAKMPAQKKGGRADKEKSERDQKGEREKEKEKEREKEKEKEREREKVKEKERGQKKQKREKSASSDSEDSSDSSQSSQTQGKKKKREKGSASRDEKGKKKSKKKDKEREKKKDKQNKKDKHKSKKVKKEKSRKHSRSKDRKKKHH